jgi:hypothetical protein
MASFGKNLLGAVALVGLVSGFASAAHAGVIDFGFNPGVGGTGADNDPNVAILGIGAGSSTIVQNVGPGNSVAGQSFTETGTLNITNYTPPGSSTGVPFVQGLSGGGSSFSGLGTTGKSLTLSFSVSGFVDNAGNLHFNGAADAVTLFLNTTGAPVTLAKFNVLPGTGGTGITSLGALPTGAVSLLLSEDVASSIPGLFTEGTTDIGGIALDLTNIQPTFQSEGGGPGANQETINVSDTGNVQLEILPEPGTLVLIGASLVGLGVVRRRKSAA